MLKEDQALPDYFAAPICRNCGGELHSAYCSACGQRKALRFGWGEVRGEAWDKLRWFETDMVKAAFRVAVNPGAVARAYVLGERKRHVHPLKLLLAAIVLLLLVIHQTDFFGSASPGLSKAIVLVRDYSKWSFSIGIVAILIASLTVFRRRGGFNAVEHLVLATYAHFVILIANILNLLPLYWWTGLDAVKAHRAISGYYMGWVEAGIVFVAFTQFFSIDLRRQWWWPLLGTAIFYAVKKGALYLYGRAVIRIVMAQLA
ncbi:DUF3667 domain-containing protein (plasmid) [Rhizobium sp. 32-5/1]|uniref:DUF3667 domain-containing protein n=1 Tax=Rhizobium sp. 32-5/1 TaxID=3019602 RepID=UPI00240D9115|nr:DUF3667 domain-containing protein [Rhizobium sp. 32-5/1]WEZ85720.1 DUF3667 domain-containing protein [Rhizobium sp. 32-5/1]